jgi:hypothetical protein
VRTTGPGGAVAAVDWLVAKYAQYQPLRPTGEAFSLAMDEVRWSSVGKDLNRSGDEQHRHHSRSHRR